MELKIGQFWRGKGRETREIVGFDFHRDCWVVLDEDDDYSAYSADTRYDLYNNWIADGWTIEKGNCTEGAYADIIM